jgi:hypothetical protein
MPTFIHVNFKQKPIVARGERLGLWQRICIFLGWPVTFMALEADDIFTVPGRSIAFTQTFTDEVLRTRQAAHAAQQQAQGKVNPNPGNQPRLVVPGR